MADIGFRDDDRLALGEERSLPWLASGLEDEEDDALDMRRVAFVAAIAFAILLLFAAAFWAVSAAGGDPAESARGEVIAAPEGPYKVRPENSGGRTFERTGDAAPGAAEGRTQQIQLKGSETVAEPEESASVPAPSPTATSPAKPGIGVQIGAYRSHGRAEQAWAELSARDVLSGRDYRIERARADIGTVYRLQALAPDLAAANALCGELKAVGMDCQVRR